jgi:hypothetical protein
MKTPKPKMTKADLKRLTDHATHCACCRAICDEQERRAA